MLGDGWGDGTMTPGDGINSLISYAVTDGDAISGFNAYLSLIRGNTENAVTCCHPSPGRGAA